MSILKINKLRSALLDYKEKNGRHAWGKISKLSGVHRTGIARIASGMQEPTIETWYKIHKALPEEIPEPSIEDNLKENKLKYMEQSENDINNSEENGLFIISNVFNIFPTIRYYLKIINTAIKNNDIELSNKTIEELKNETIPNKKSEKKERKMYISKDVIKKYPQIKYYLEALNIVSYTENRELFKDIIHKMSNAVVSKKEKDL